MTWVFATCHSQVPASSCDGRVGMGASWRQAGKIYRRAKRESHSTRLTASRGEQSLCPVDDQTYTTGVSLNFAVDLATYLILLQCCASSCGLTKNEQRSRLTVYCCCETNGTLYPRKVRRICQGRVASFGCRTKRSNGNSLLLALFPVDAFSKLGR